MRLLVAAIACHPEGGSELYVGWSAVTALAQEHEVTVLTHGYSREAIARAMADHPLRDRLRFHHLRPPLRWHQNRLIARFQDWRELAVWSRVAAAKARELHADSPFDMAHHVTIATWRMPSPLSGLGIPWVWGPVGGGEVFPSRFLGILSPAAKLFELARIVGNHRAVRSKSLRACARDAGFILANNRETRALMLRLGAEPDRVGMLSQSFFTPARIARFRHEEPKPPSGQGLRIFAGGNLEGRKGVSIALHALRQLADRGIPFRFRYGGQGPEYAHLCRLAARLGLGPEQVSLGEILAPEDYVAALHESHIYLLPSLREGAPLTMIEAMLAGCVPVVADCGGGGVLVDETCGLSLPVTDPGRMAGAIADGLASLAVDPARMEALGRAARERVESRCSQDFYLAEIREAYERAAARAKGRAAR